MEPTLVRGEDPALVVHSWSLDRAAEQLNPPVYIPKSYVVKKSKGLRVGRSRGLKDVTFHGDPRLGHAGGISVVGDLKHDDMRAIAVYALEFEDMLVRTIGGRPRNIVYRLRFYSNDRDYRLHAAHAGASTAMSFYDPRTRDIVMWFNEKMTHDQLQGLVAHEFTHAYMDIVFDCVSPLWFAEGMAEYFQNFTWEGDRAVPGALNEPQLAELGASLLHIRGQRLLPIDEFVRLGRDSFYGPNFKTLYAQAWTVVRFLAEFEPETIKELLERQPIDVNGLDREWRGYLNAMLKKI